MPSVPRLSAAAAFFATALLLAGCAPGGATTGPATDDDTTTDDTTTHDDPFAPEPPTTGDGWTERYRDIPWLSDDLDNDDFFVTGSVDGHDVMGIFCSDDGNGTGSILSSGDASVDLELQTSTDFDVTVARSQYLTYTGIGTFELPSEPQGTHPVSFSFSSSMEYDASPGKDTAAESSADLSIEMLGVPYPDPATCRAEQDALFSWVSSNGGH